MAKVSKKKLRRLNQRAGSGVMPSVHPMTNVVLKPIEGLPEGLGKSQGVVPTFADLGIAKRKPAPFIGENLLNDILTSNRESSEGRGVLAKTRHAIATGAR